MRLPTRFAPIFEFWERKRKEAQAAAKAPKAAKGRPQPSVLTPAKRAEKRVAPPPLRRSLEDIKADLRKKKVADPPSSLRRIPGVTTRSPGTPARIASPPAAGPTGGSYGRNRPGKSLSGCSRSPRSCKDRYRSSWGEETACQDREKIQESRRIEAALSVGSPPNSRSSSAGSRPPPGGTSSRTCHRSGQTRSCRTSCSLAPTHGPAPGRATPLRASSAETGRAGSGADHPEHHHLRRYFRQGTFREVGCACPRRNHEVAGPWSIRHHQSDSGEFPGHRNFARLRRRSRNRDLRRRGPAGSSRDRKA